MIRNMEKYVIIVDSAAPVMFNSGISNILKSTLITKPAKVIAKIDLVLPVKKGAAFRME